jgi:fluoroquinolone transport system permease protein
MIMTDSVRSKRPFQIVRALGPVDLRSVRRDPLLRLILVLPILIVLLLRLGLPDLTARVQEAYRLNLAEYYGWFTAVIALLVPMLTGIVVGFLLLDQRDDHTLSALQVTPLTLAGYLVYRLGMPVVVSVLLTAAVLWGGALVPLDGVDILLISAAAAPTAPLMALFLAAFAANKVQGLALQKASGVFLLPPMFAYFLPAPWNWLMAVFPAFWPAALTWERVAGSSSGWPLFFGGQLYHAVLIGLLLRRVLRQPPV